jgi:hypothetical protein
LAANSSRLRPRIMRAILMASLLHETPALAAEGLYNAPA